MKTAPLRVLLSLLALALACDGGGERKAVALAERFEVALGEPDIATATQIIEELQEVLPETAESSLRLAKMLARVGKLSEALWLLEDAERVYPENTEIKLGIAETALLVANASRAFTAVAEIPEGDPHHAYAQLLRARAQLGLGDLPASLATLRQAWELHPERAELGISLIEGLIGEDDYDGALALIAEVRSIEGLEDEPRSWLALTEAMILTNQGKIDQALAALDSLLAREPNNVDAWIHRINLLLGRGEAELACTLLAEAIERQPDVLDLYAFMATAQTARGDLEAARRAQQQIVDRVTGAEARISLASHLQASGQLEEALAVLEGTEPGQPRAQVAEIAYLKVAYLLEAGRNEEARVRFSEFANGFEEDPQVELLRARFELLEGNASAAARRLRIVASKLDRADVQHWLGIALDELGDNAGAEYRFGMALRRDPRQVASHVGLIRALERRGAWGEMIGASLKLVALEPDNAFAFDALVRGLLASQRVNEAEEVLRTYSEKFPGSVAAAVGLSTALRRQGRPADALTELDAVADRFDSQPSFLAERAIVLQLLGRDAEALGDVERAIAAGVRDGSLERAHAYLLFMAGRSEEAAQAVELALQLLPEDPTPLQMLGDYLSMQRDFAAAARAYERYLKRRPGDPAVFSRLGDAFARQDQRAAAIDAYREAIRLDDVSLHARNNLAQMLQLEGRIDEALEAAQAAYARAEDQPIVMDTLGWLFVAKGRPERAVALLSKAQRLAPESLETRYHLAVGLREAGQLAEARELLNELQASLEPEHELYAKVEEAAASLR
jgi:tetratricopeptide (TPR) repeat protein